MNISHFQDCVWCQNLCKPINPVHILKKFWELRYHLSIALRLTQNPLLEFYNPACSKWLLQHWNPLSVNPGSRIVFLHFCCLTSLSTMSTKFQIDSLVLIFQVDWLPSIAPLKFRLIKLIFVVQISFHLHTCLCGCGNQLLYSVLEAKLKTNSRF